LLGWAVWLVRNRQLKSERRRVGKVADQSDRPEPAKPWQVIRKQLIENAKVVDVLVWSAVAASLFTLARYVLL
jgi:hypothetical protein